MKTALVTGGTGDIGRAIIRRLVESGYRVIFTYEKNERMARSLSAMLGAEGIRCDISDDRSVEDLFRILGEKGESVDILVNNAGISREGLFIDSVIEDWKDMFDVNFFGAVRMTGKVLPDMLSRGEGIIINMASIWGIKGASCESIYAATKAALINLTKSLSNEYARSGIRVNAVAPGFIEGRMNSHYSTEDREEILEEIPEGRFGTPDDVAKTVVFLAGDDSGYITGQTISVDGGWSQI
ncbi:MAG: SDR family oxidoreductase [Clostridia bacterium]|nr:SDR family oxidoreductase [Clostridia bacterium]MBR0438836.1 SDR family oxidoreductase [Clostridia bacterium]MBR6135272.1 SDR family oxidoreductase [Clostridia bacterium]